MYTDEILECLPLINRKRIKICCTDNNFHESTQALRDIGKRTIKDWIHGWFWASKMITGEPTPFIFTKEELKSIKNEFDISFIL